MDHHCAHKRKQRLPFFPTNYHMRAALQHVRCAYLLSMALCANRLASLAFWRREMRYIQRQNYGGLRSLCLAGRLQASAVLDAFPSPHWIRDGLCRVSFRSSGSR